MACPAAGGPAPISPSLTSHFVVPSAVRRLINEGDRVPFQLPIAEVMKSPPTATAERNSSPSASSMAANGPRSRGAPATGELSTIEPPPTTTTAAQKHGHATGL